MRGLLGASGLRYRVRIKPSWSARVYGTYHIGLRHILLAAAVVPQLLVLTAYLVVLNVGTPALSPTLEVHRRSRAAGEHKRTVELPHRLQSLDERSRQLFGESFSLATMLGLEFGGEPTLGLGRFETRGATGSQVSAPRLVADVGLLQSRFARLAVELGDRAEEFRYTPSVPPLLGDFVPTSTFGPRRSPFTGRGEVHRGQDIAADTGARIVATADGTVVVAQHDPRRNPMGRYVVIDHGGRFRTYYGHCHRLLVEEGQQVSRHQVIAEVGSSGRSTGPHVHYEVRRGGKPEDPRVYMAFHPAFADDGYEDLFGE